MRKNIISIGLLVVLSFIFMNFKQDYLKENKPTSLNNFEQSGGNTILKTGEFQSPNFRQGQAGWKMNSEGSVEFADGTFRGTIDVLGTTDDGSSSEIIIDSDLGEIDIYLDGALRASLQNGGVSFFAPLGGAGGTLASLGGNQISLILGDGTINAIDFIDNGDTTAKLVPQINNKITLGTASLKWSDVRSVLINGADIGFANGWKFREWPAKKEDIGKPDEWMRENANLGIQLLDENDNLIAVFHKNGTLYTDKVKPLSELNKSSNNSRNFFRTLWLVISKIF